MILCKIKDKKDFMGKLLTSESFDSFLLKEATVYGFVPYQIDGHINKAFFDTAESDTSSFLTYEYAQWKDIRPVCFDLIKGRRTPTKFIFVLYLKPEAVNAMFEQAGISSTDSLVQNLILNIRFDQGEMNITTGIDYYGFTLDKSAEQLWDATTLKFLDKKEIAYENLSCSWKRNR